jgi:hypothetical protein
VTTVVGLLEFDGRKVAVDLKQPVVVEPVDVVQGRGLDLFGDAPWAAGLDQLCFEQVRSPIRPGRYHLGKHPKCPIMQ